MPVCPCTNKFILRFGMKFMCMRFVSFGICLVSTDWPIGHYDGIKNGNSSDQALKYNKKL